MLEAEYDCACPGPPPQFQLPPPPLPPLLQDSACSDASVSSLYSCDILPVLDAELHSSPTIPSTIVIAVAAVLVFAMVLAASVLLCRYKRKTPNMVACKASPQNRVCDVPTANDVIYEDLSNVRPKHCVQPVQMRDFAPALYHAATPAVCASSVFVCPDRYTNEDLYTPVYQEIIQGRCESDPDSEAAAVAASEDEFAEDELSLEDVCPRQPPAPPPPTLWLDSLLRYHPNATPACVSPYETVPVVNFSTFRPPPGHDSDSGYSHNTSNGRQYAPRISGSFA